MKAIMLDNFEPTPKNPTIADFFHQIGRADELGSGTRNLTKYSAMYSGKAPTLTEGDVFVAQVPVPWNTQIDVVRVPDTAEKVRDTASEVRDTVGKVRDTGVLTDGQREVLHYVQEKGEITAAEVEKLLHVQERRAQIILVELMRHGLLRRVGAARSTRYVLADGATENADQ